MEFKEYLVIYDRENFVKIKAVSLKDCIVQVADYVGDNSPLFQTALRGCDTYESIIEMFNHFSNCDINLVFGIGKIIYNDKSLFEQEG